MTIETMKQALEALEWCSRRYAGCGPSFIPESITSLRQVIAEAEDNYQGSDAAKAAHMMDLYTALGVKWGEDPFAVIAKMRSIAGAEKQERPTGPATSADRYFYEAGFEAGRQQGMKQEQGKPVAWRNAAIRVGEDLCSVGPHGYYEMNAEQWLDWALSVVTVHLPPQQRTWVGLTESDRRLINFQWQDGNGTATEIIDLVEAKLKEKNT
jgi:hypothetical protein